MTDKKDIDNLNQQKQALGSVNGMGFRHHLEDQNDTHLQAIQVDSVQRIFLESEKNYARQAVEVFDQYQEMFKNLEDNIENILASLPSGSKDYQNMMAYLGKVKEIHVQTLRDLSNPNYFRKVLKSNPEALKNKVESQIKIAYQATGAHINQWNARSNQHINDLENLIKEEQQSVNLLSKRFEQHRYHKPSPRSKIVPATSISPVDSPLGENDLTPPQETVSQETPFPTVQDEAEKPKKEQKSASTEVVKSNKNDELILAKIGGEIGKIVGTLTQMAIKTGFNAAVAGVKCLFKILKEGAKASYHALTEKVNDRPGIQHQDKMLAKAGQSVEMDETKVEKKENIPDTPSSPPRTFS